MKKNMDGTKPRRERQSGALSQPGDKNQETNVTKNGKQTC